MKKLFLALTLLLSLSTYAQWETKHYVDDFGEKTDKTYQSMVCKGTFSNSATQNSKALYSFVKGESSFYIKVYEYGSHLATHTDHTFEEVKVKTPNGDIVTYKRVFFTKDGLLYFDKENFKRISSMLKNKGNYIMIFNRSSSYYDSNYKIKFEIE